MRMACSILLLASLLVPSASGGVYHVSKAGDDSNSGVQGSPFRTLGKASEVLQPGDTCLVHAGVYRECFRPKNDGLSGKPIVLQAAKGERVVLSGMEAMDDWQLVGAGIYKAQASWSLGESNFVLIDHRMGFEARFPNKTNDDPLDVEGATIIEEHVSQKGAGETLPNPVRFKSEVSLPEPCTTRNLSGAKVWVLAHRKWSGWVAPVTGYSPKERQIWFREFEAGQIANNANPNYLQGAYGRGSYYLFGAKALLDCANEWFFDEEAQELYVMVSGQKRPATGQVAFRKREVVVDLRNRNFCDISGFEIEGAAIDMRDAEHCSVDRCKLSYCWRHVPTQSSRALNAKHSGVAISGRNNVFKNSEVAYSAGAGVTLSGESNTVSNNLMHGLNYLGSISTGALMVNGSDHQITYNTIHSTGRDLIKYKGANSVIAWNHLYNPGMICYDLGAIYSGGTDYQNTRIHHNLIHNDNEGHPFNGVYFDNFTNNGIVHHNIIWGNIRSGVRNNRPGNYHQIFNNTTISIDNRWSPWQGPATQFGSTIVNNYAGNPIMANEEVFQANNVHRFPFDTEAHKPLEPEPAEGFGKAGFPNYVGAIAGDAANWSDQAGHDFTRRSIPTVDRELPFMRNYIRNGSFDWIGEPDGGSSQTQEIACWEPSGRVDLSYSSGFNFPAPDARDSIYANSLLLESDDASISQTVEGLKPDSPYAIGVYVRPYDAAEIALTVQSASERNQATSKQVPVTAGWKFLALCFRTGLRDTHVTVHIHKEGEGRVYLDNIGLVPDLSEFLGAND